MQFDGTPRAGVGAAGGFIADGRGANRALTRGVFPMISVASRLILLLGSTATASPLAAATAVPRRRGRPGAAACCCRHAWRRTWTPGRGLTAALDACSRPVVLGAALRMVAIATLAIPPCAGPDSVNWLGAIVHVGHADSVRWPVTGFGRVKTQVDRPLAERLTNLQTSRKRVWDGCSRPDRWVGVVFRLHGVPGS